MDNRYGRYEVLQKLGQGAMAEVHLARDPVLSRFVAIKVLHAELSKRKDIVQRFFNEAKTVAVIRNPHVVEVFDFGQQGKDFYLVMEFVDGPSLLDILKQLKGPSGGSSESAGIGSGERKEDQYIVSEPLDARVAASIVCQAAEGLIIAAQNGVVHRDIKPENLLINRQGYLKISDFGIAHIQDDSLTKTGAILGSPLYMSPEQTRGLKPITYQSDIFSLGAVLYTCLAGRPPFKGKNLADLFRQIAGEPHIPLSQLRPNLDSSLLNLTHMLLEKDPQLRGEGPKWLHRQLKDYLMNQGVADPAELLSGYMQELADRGIRTGWKSNGLAPTMIRSGDTHQSTQAVKRKKISIPMPAAVIFALAMFGGGLWFGVSQRKLQREPQVSSIVSQSAEPGNSIDSAPVVSATVPIVGSEVDLGQGSKSEEVSHRTQEQPVAVTPSEEMGTVLLQSSPPFAEVFVDGQFVGITPVQVELPISQRHRFAIKGKNSLSLDTMMALRAGSQSLKFTLSSGQPSRLAESPAEDEQ